MIYRIAWVVVLVFLKVAAGFRVQGKENQIPTGPVVVVSNHVSNWDPLAVGTALDRRIHYMGKEELFKNPLLAWLLRRLCVFPVKRGISPKSAIVESLKILRSGEMLGIFPEGTRSRSGELQKANSGAVMLALKTQAPILPVALINTKSFKKMRAVIGKPIYIHLEGQQKPSREEMEQFNHEVMNSIRKLLEVS